MLSSVAVHRSTFEKAQWTSSTPLAGRSTNEGVELGDQFRRATTHRGRLDRAGCQQAVGLVRHRGLARAEVDCPLERRGERESSSPNS